MQCVHITAHAHDSACSPNKRLLVDGWPCCCKHWQLSGFYCLPCGLSLPCISAWCSSVHTRSRPSTRLSANRLIISLPVSADQRSSGMHSTVERLLKRVLGFRSTSNWRLEGRQTKPRHNACNGCALARAQPHLLHVDNHRHAQVCTFKHTCTPPPSQHKPAMAPMQQCRHAHLRSSRSSCTCSEPCLRDVRVSGGSPGAPGAAQLSRRHRPARPCSKQRWSLCCCARRSASFRAATASCAQFVMSPLEQSAEQPRHQSWRDATVSCAPGGAVRAAAATRARARTRLMLCCRRRPSGACLYNMKPLGAPCCTDSPAAVSFVRSCCHQPWQLEIMLQPPHHLL